VIHECHFKIQSLPTQCFWWPVNRFLSIHRTIT
jgi:hypothetical protein